MLRAAALLLLVLHGCGAEEPPPAYAAPEDPDALAARHRALKEQLRALVGDLEAAGRYDCCIEHPCNECAMRMGGCKCGEGLRNGDPVCEECAMMWRSGQGAEPDVDPASVRSFLEAQREAEERAKASVAPPAPAPVCACPNHAAPTK